MNWHNFFDTLSEGLFVAWICSLFTQTPGAFKWGLFLGSIICASLAAGYK